MLEKTSAIWLNLHLGLIKKDFMETIIGLGTAGCNVAEAFLEHSQYDVYRIDTRKRTGKKFKLFPKCKTHEEYEKKCPSLKTFFKNAKPPYLFVLSGASEVSGASLRVMEQLNSRDLYVLYLRPDVSLLSGPKKKQERTVFQVLQQYARSAVFKKMYVIDNVRLGQIIKDAPIIGYYEKLNNFLVSTLHMINYCNNIEPELETYDEPVAPAAIATIGLGNLETGEEEMFFTLQNPREKIYHYMINKQKLQSQSDLLKRITDRARSRMEGGKVQVSFGIYSTDYDEDYVYVVSSASLIQDEIIS